MTIRYEVKFVHLIISYLKGFHIHFLESQIVNMQLIIKQKIFCLYTTKSDV